MKFQREIVQNRAWNCLGLSWGLLGCLIGVLERLGSILGASWERLGASWRRPRSISEPEGNPTWTPRRADQKRSKKMYVYMYVYKYVCMYMYRCMCVGESVHVCMYVYMYVWMYKYVCVHVCKRTRWSADLHHSTSLQRQDVSGLYGQPGRYNFLQLHETAVEAASAVADVINIATEGRSSGNERSACSGKTISKQTQVKCIANEAAELSYYCRKPKHCHEGNSFNIWMWRFAETILSQAIHTNLTLVHPSLFNYRVDLYSRLRLDTISVS